MNPHAAPAGRFPASGFTLVEVVVALALLALVMLGALSGLRTIGQASEKLDSQAMSNEDHRLVPVFLHSVVATASSRQRIDPRSLQPQLWFLGESGEISWLGMMPARHGAGGLTHFRLYLDRNRESLILQLVPYQPELEELDWEDVESRVILENVSELNIRYRGALETEWLTTWDERFVLPEWVSLNLSERGRQWPPVVVRILQAALREGGSVVDAGAQPVGLPQ